MKLVVTKIYEVKRVRIKDILSNPDRYRHDWFVEDELEDPWKFNSDWMEEQNPQKMLYVCYYAEERGEFV